jgi:uncharacterized protein (TIGR02145 family)
MKKRTLIIPAIIALGAGAVANTYADSASTDFSITVNPSASLTVSAASVNLDMTPTQAGVYDSDTLTVTASTNNTTGYTLVLETNNTALESDTINPNTGTKPTIPSIAESQDGITAAAFAASTDSNVLNHWGIAIGSANFNAIKASQTLKTTSAPAVGDATVLTMASKLDLLTVPGIYSTTLNFEMTTNPLPDTLESAYAKANKQKATIDGHDYYAMQDMNSTICADVDIPSELQVYDTRDNHIYTIGRLADNRCWLLDNLALDLTNSTTLAALSDTNTNASTTTLGYLRGTTSRNPSQDPNGNYATAGVSSFDWSSLPNYTSPLININSKDTVSLNNMDTAGGWKIGGYYNFCAASAGSYCYSEGHFSVNDASEDICPTGWRLPTGGYSVDGEYEVVAAAIATEGQYGYTGEGYGAIRNALHLPLSGILGYQEDSNQGSYGLFWSATRNSSNNTGMYYMYTTISSINPWSFHGSGEDIYNGASIRCIAK